MSDLEGRVALVTGGSGEIGSAICRALVARGAAVCVNYLRNRESAERVVSGIEEVGGSAWAVQANVASPREVDHLVKEATAPGGRLDIIVHCASLGTFKPLMDTRPSQWDLTFGVHAKGLWLVAGAAAPHMSRGGSVVALSSLGSSRFTPAYGAVGPAKAALETLVRYLAAELADREIRVNAVAGGPIDGDRLRGSPAYSAIVAAARERPCGRLGTADELANVVLFLSSPAARWIQGQVLVADGGFSLW